MFGTAPDWDIPWLHYCWDYYKFSWYHTVIWDYFWNGSDWDCTIASNTTLPTRVYNFRNLTICPWVVVNFCWDQAAIIRATWTLCNLWTIDLRSDKAIPAWDATYSTYGYLENKPSKWVVTFTCTWWLGWIKVWSRLWNNWWGYCEFGCSMNYGCWWYPYCCNWWGWASSCGAQSAAQYAVNWWNATATSGWAWASWGRDCNWHYAPWGWGWFGWQCGWNWWNWHNNDWNAYYSWWWDWWNWYLCRWGNGWEWRPWGDGWDSYCWTWGNGWNSSCSTWWRWGNSVRWNGWAWGSSWNWTNDKRWEVGWNGWCSMYWNGWAWWSWGQWDCEWWKGWHWWNVLWGQYWLVLAGRTLYNCRVIWCGWTGWAWGYTPKHRYSTWYEQYGGDWWDGWAWADVKMFYETLVSSWTICNKWWCGWAAWTSWSWDNYRWNPWCDGWDWQLEIRNYKNVQLCIDYLIVWWWAWTPWNGWYTAEIGWWGWAVCFANWVNITNIGTLAVTVWCGWVHWTSRCAASNGWDTCLWTLAVAPWGRTDGTSWSWCTAWGEAYPRPGTYREAAWWGAWAWGNGWDTLGSCSWGNGWAWICGYWWWGWWGWYATWWTACDWWGRWWGYNASSRHESANNYWWGWGWTWYRANWVSQSWADWCQWVVFVCYPKDGSYGIKRATWGNECYECNWYCVHKFTSDWEFVPTQW